MNHELIHEIDSLARAVAPTSEEQNQPDSTKIWFTKGTVTALAGTTATVQFAQSTPVATSPVAGISYLNRPQVGDVVMVAVLGVTRLILGSINGGAGGKVFAEAWEGNARQKTGTGDFTVASFTASLDPSHVYAWHLNADIFSSSASNLTLKVMRAGVQQSYGGQLSSHYEPIALNATSPGHRALLFTPSSSVSALYALYASQSGAGTMYFGSVVPGQTWVEDLGHS